MAKSSYAGGKRSRHFTLSDQAYAHLSLIAGNAQLSRSEALERLLRSSSPYEADVISDVIWPEIIDYTSSPSPFDEETTSLSQDNF